MAASVAGVSEACSVASSCLKLRMVKRNAAATVAPRKSVTRFGRGVADDAFLVDGYSLGRVSGAPRDGAYAGDGVRLPCADT